MFVKASYITHLAAMLLLTSPPPTAFIALTNLLSRPCLQAFYTNHQPDIDAYYRVFENLQADSFPKIYANCKNLGIRLPESWFRGMLVEQIPFECACRLWDQVGYSPPFILLPIDCERDNPNKRRSYWMEMDTFSELL